MRVLQLISSNGFYGAESVVAALSSGLTLLECDVEIAVFNLSSMPECDQERLREQSAVIVHDLSFKGAIAPRAILRLVRLIRARQIDVIHCHGYKADILGLVAARMTRCKIIATCHNWTNATAALRRNSRLDLLALRHVHCTVAVSDAVFTTLRFAGVPDAALRRIDNGINVAAYDSIDIRPEDLSTPILGAVSRLSSEKGIDVLVRALPQIVAEHPTLICRVVGAGPDREALLTLAEELGVSDHLRLEGFCSDIPAFLRECTVVALPSRTEGMPLAVLEAMASCRPVVASAVGSVPYLLLDGAAGLLVTPDDHETLAAGICKLLSNSELRNQMAARALEHVTAHFDLKSMARKYLEVYVELLTSPAEVPLTQCERADA
jgi:glycosyltransferase involved in cell wall biosynthesis